MSLEEFDKEDLAKVVDDVCQALYNDPTVWRKHPGKLDILQNDFRILVNASTVFNPITGEK